MKKKKAFITGVTGQDGSYLAELLLDKDYEVHAIQRRASVFNTQRIEKIQNHENFHTYYGDMTDSSNLHRLIEKIGPDEVYNLAAQSHVAVSFEVPEYTGEVDAIGTARLLDAIRNTQVPARFYQASTSELFGGLPGTAPQNEQTPFYPKSPYGAAKLYAYWLTVNYRESYNLFAVNGILFNHESPRRGETFVTKKISKAVARISKGTQDKLVLGNLGAKRDWGYAKEYVLAMWKMLQMDTPEDLVIATGYTYTIRDFVQWCFEYVGIKINWIGEGVYEKGVDPRTGKTLVEVSDHYFRPAEVELLHGDPARAIKKLDWKPQTYGPVLAHLMVEYDLLFNDYGFD
uniref:GDP-mannose 4,6-dehydratase n=1 Tax=Algoriphagus sp. TaxID=1872435 RepID=UPI0040476B0E